LIDAGFLDSHMSASDYRFASAPSVSLRGTFFRKHTRENMSKNAEKYNRVCTHTETADQMHEDSRLKSNHIRRTLSKSKKNIYEFHEKFKRKILDADNDVLYEHTKNQLKIPWSPCCTKMIKTRRFWDFQFCNVYIF
jgi:hypothetical protein